jgi:hypothetical protein
MTEKRLGNSKERVTGTVTQLCFLPAPKTWIEFKDPRLRMGFFLADVAPNRVSVLCFHDNNPEPFFAGYLHTDTASVETPPDCDPQYGKAIQTACLFLMLINTPKIIGRQQHMPSRVLERKLTKGFGVGKFPLHAWTEIQLHVAKPIEIDDGQPHEAHLTGQRALHFVRKHIRVRRGQLEYVSAHWRGDPAIGIKRTRYTVTP